MWTEIVALNARVENIAASEISFTANHARVVGAYALPSIANVRTRTWTGFESCTTGFAVKITNIACLRSGITDALLTLFVDGEDITRRILTGYTSTRSIARVAESTPVVVGTWIIFEHLSERTTASCWIADTRWVAPRVHDAVDFFNNDALSLMTFSACTTEIIGFTGNSVIEKHIFADTRLLCTANTDTARI